MEDNHDSQKDLSEATSKVANALGKLNQIGHSASFTEDKKDGTVQNSEEKKENSTEEKKEETNPSASTASQPEEKKEETVAPASAAPTEEKKESSSTEEKKENSSTEEKKEEEKKEESTEEKKVEGEEKKEEGKEDKKEGEEKKEETKEEKKKREKEEKEKKEKEEKEKKKKEKEEKEKKEKEEKERKKKEKEEKEKEDREKYGDKKKGFKSLRGRKKPAAVEEEEKKEGAAAEAKEGEEKKEGTAEEPKEGEEKEAVVAEVKEGEEKKAEGEEKKEKEDSDSSDDEKDGKKEKPEKADKAEKAEKAEEKPKEPRKKGDLETFLEKRGEIGVVKGWKRRHFRLFSEENKIHYFKNEESADLVGTVDLATATGFSVGEKKEKTRHFHTFDIKSTGRTWHLRTENKEEHEAWVNHLGKSLSLTPSKTESSENKEVSPKASVEHVNEEGENKGENGAPAAESDEAKPVEGSEADSKRESVAVAELNGKEEVKEEESFVPKVEEEVPHPQRELVAGDTALFVHKENPSSTVVEVRNLHVGEDGSVVVHDLPHTFVHKTLAFRSLTDSEASLGSSSFPNDPSAPNKEAKLNLSVDTEHKNQDHLVELLYHTKGGLNYSVEYNAVLDAKDRNIQLTGSYAISNTTGKSYKGASVFLVSTGLVRQETEAAQAPAPTSRLTRSLSIKNLGLPKSVTSAKSFDHPPVSKTLTNLLPRPVHLEDQSTTNVKFVAANFPVKAENLIYSVPATFNGGEPQTEREYPHNVSHTFNAQKVVSFANNKENKLGLDLPAGTLTVSRRELDGFGTLSALNSVPFKAEEAGRTVFVEIGSLPGVFATRKVTKFEHDKKNGKLTESFEVTIQNTTHSVVSVSVVEAAYRGRSFELVNSVGWEKGNDADSDKLNATATVKPNDKKVLSYTLVYTVPAEVKK
eukprot:TRINITY_DN1523_c1_g1_i2.p1 TRINITY_DN1523_c1_g1~~TRINITY_DN1523_c1_g1_i2.p1  ORF type:complete len:921 (+),score=535.68 TRINITY_DN1523_c1_g1_i2:184-2946(+)